MEKRIALVTGGLKGIGQAICEKLAQDGFITYATSRTPNKNFKHDNIIPIRMDITSELDYKSVINQISKEQGRLDLLINNAGIGLFGPFEDLDKNKWEEVIKTNIIGTMGITQEVFPMLQVRGGRIIQISSIATKRALPYNSIYASSKMAMKGFGEVLAEEWSNYSIGVTNIHLGATYTDIWKELEGFSKEDMLRVEDVARVVSFIAETPLHVRIDELTLTPPKGIL
jgi:NAD(P)-dependent dehydrogenase (short-subunit alcohol dehydrogenase family)